MSSGFWVSLAATGAFAAGATLTGVLTANAKSDEPAEQASARAPSLAIGPGHLSLSGSF